MKNLIHMFVLLLIMSFSINAQVSIDIEGQIHHAIKDYADENGEITKHEEAMLIREAKTGKTFELKFLGKTPELKADQNVRVKGQLHANQIVLMNDGVTSTETQGPIVAQANVSKHALAIIMDFTDATATTTIDGVNDHVFNTAAPKSTANYFHETSHQSLSLTGEVIRVQIDASIGSSCAYTTWSSQGNSAAQALGYNLSQYTHLMYVLPTSAPCGWTGLGSLGNWGGQGVLWVKGYYSGVYSHEFGHNLGMNHAARGTSEYGDGSDVMGGALNHNELNGPHRVQMGWTNKYSNAGLGDYQIAPLSNDPADSTLDQVLIVAKPDTSENYYISYRRKEGAFDSNMNALYADQVNIHTQKGSGKTYFIDALAVGESFTDVVNGISISVSETSAGIASLRIDAECAENAPTISLSPATQSGAPGQIKNYTATVTNKNGVFCGASTFNLSLTSDSNLSGSLSASSLNLASGASGNITVSMSAATDSLEGSFAFQVGVEQVSYQTSGASVNGSLVIDLTAPNAPTNLQASVNRKGQISLSWNAPSGERPALYKILRNGQVIGQTTSLSFSDKPASSGIYVYEVLAEDSSGNQSAKSNSVSIEIATKGGGGSGGGGGPGKGRNK